MISFKKRFKSHHLLSHEALLRRLKPKYRHNETFKPIIIVTEPVTLAKKVSITNFPSSRKKTFSIFRASDYKTTPIFSKLILLSLRQNLYFNLNQKILKVRYNIMACINSWSKLMEIGKLAIKIPFSKLKFKGDI